MVRNRARILMATVAIALGSISQTALAQYASYFGNGAQPSGAASPGGMHWRAAPVMPAGYYPNQMQGHAMPGPMRPAGFQGGAPPEELGEGVMPEESYGEYQGQEGYGDYGDSGCCGECGGEGGCSSCGAGLLGSLFGPYQDGSCGPRWFDISAEGLYLTREHAGRAYDFTSDGLNGNRILGTGDLEYQHELGYRVTGRYNLGAASDFEASYLGGFTWRTGGQANSATDNLYSVVSNFGLNPATGYVETDQATLHQIDYVTQLETVEFSYRHHWISPSQRLQGSWLIGFRYASLDEGFNYFTSAELHNDPLNGGAARGPGFMNYHTGTTNHLFGVQIGGDAYACILPGLTVGGEVKAGAYENHAKQRTSITATSVAGSIEENVTTDDLALVAEAGLTAVYQIGPGWSIRGGYELLYFDGVALAGENFNPDASFLVGGPARAVSINDNGAAFFHGFTGGVEWLW